MHQKGTIRKGLVIDHIDGNKTNNVIENLRAITPRQNALNRECHRKGNLPGARKVGNKYVAGITLKYSINLQAEDTKEDSNDNYKFAIWLIERGLKDPDKIKEAVKHYSDCRKAKSKRKMKHIINQILPYVEDYQI